jgi:hypothetical protein
MTKQKAGLNEFWYAYAWQFIYNITFLMTLLIYKIIIDLT